MENSFCSGACVAPVPRRITIANADICRYEWIPNLWAATAVDCAVDLSPHICDRRFLWNTLTYGSLVSPSEKRVIQVDHVVLIIDERDQSPLVERCARVGNATTNEIAHNQAIVFGKFEVGVLIV